LAIVIKLYGIVNCNTVKSARAWLDARRIPYDFVDFKKTPPTLEQIARWCDVLGAGAVVNRKGTTWRKLDPATQARANTKAGAVAMLVEHPSAIKRPVIETGTRLLIGFDAEAYDQGLRG
jgi:arsenate reductase (glutaredoxin)